MDTEKNQEETVEFAAVIGDDLTEVLGYAPEPTVTVTMPGVPDDHPVLQEITADLQAALTAQTLADEYSGTEVTGDDLTELLSYAPETPESLTVEVVGPAMTEAEANALRAQLVHESSSGFTDIGIKKLPHYAGPERMKPATIGSAGFDLYSANSEPILLNSMGARVVIPTGFILELPVGFEAQIRSRSGLAAKNGIVVTNSPGTVDADYRGEIMVILTNTSNNRFTVERGMRIAQMVISRVPLVRLVDIDEVSETDRGSGGFGSTGL